MNLDEEKNLLDDIKKDPSRFAAIFDHWHNPIYNYIFRRTGDADLANDIVSETFLKAFLNIHSFTWKNISIASWLYRIATNETNMYFRNKKYRPESFERLFNKKEFIMAITNETDKKTLALEDTKNYNDYLMLRNLLATMEIKYQEVIALRYFEKKSLAEISNILQKKEGTVKSLLSRGLQKLRNLSLQPNIKNAL